MASLVNLLLGLLEHFDQPGKEDLVSRFSREFERQLRETDLPGFLKSVGCEPGEAPGLSLRSLEGLGATLGLYLEHFEKLPNVDVSAKTLLALTVQQTSGESIAKCVGLCEHAASLRPTLVLVLAHKLYQEDLCDALQDSLYQTILMLCRRMDSEDSALKLAFLDYLLTKGKDLQSLKACSDFTRLLLEQAPLEFANRLLDFGYVEEAVRTLCRVLDLNRQLAIQFAGHTSEDCKPKSGIYIDPQAASKVGRHNRSSTRGRCSPRAWTLR